MNGSPITVKAVFLGGVGRLQPGDLAVTSGVPLALKADVTAPSYTLTVTNGQGKSLSRTVALVVYPQSSLLLTPMANPITNGAMVGLKVALPPGATATVDGFEGGVVNGQILNLVTASEGATQVVTLHATLAGGQAAITAAKLDLVPPPVATALVASKAVVVPGEAIMLTPLFAGGAGVIDGGIGPVANGLAYATPPVLANQVFTLTVTNAAGSLAQTSAAVTLVPGPVIESFVASSVAPPLGTSVSLRAVFSNGAGTIDGKVGPVVSGQSVRTGPIVAPTVFTLTVQGLAGSPRLATVQVIPMRVTVSGLPQGNVLSVGKSLAFQATVSGAPTNGLDWYVDGILGGNSVSGFISVSGNYVAPLTLGDHVIKAVATTGGGASQSAEVKIVELPIIRSFTVN
jgi:hypothetical protein